LVYSIFALQIFPVPGLVLVGIGKANHSLGKPVYVI